MTEKNIGLWSAVSIGIGGMVGGGIFAVLGLAVQLARGSTPMAFFIGGVVALITSYSYAKLSVAYPSRGGTVEFLNQAFGTGIFTGGLNILLYLSYIVMLSLYSFAFGSYGATFFGGHYVFWKHVLITIVIILFTVINLFGSKFVGESEKYIVGIKISILLLFIFAGFWSVNAARLSPQTWVGSVQLVAGGMIVFLAYEGFELISNTAEDVSDVNNTLPKAYYISVIFVIFLYVLIAIVAIGNLPISQLVNARDYALAEAAKPFFGRAGFILIAIAAMLSTGSAINATLYSSARVSYVIAKDGEMPNLFEKKVWRKPVEGLLLTSVLTLVVANFFDLSSISLLGSAGFLIVFGLVNVANYKMNAITKGNKIISFFGAFLTFFALVMMLWQEAYSNLFGVLIFICFVALSFLLELFYRSLTGRTLKYHIKVKY